MHGSALVARRVMKYPPFLSIEAKRGQCPSNTNTLASGHGHPPDQLKTPNSNVIRDRGLVQVLPSSSISRYPSTNAHNGSVTRNVL